jgi:hypothetical protein
MPGSATGRLKRQSILVDSECPDRSRQHERERYRRTADAYRFPIPVCHWFVDSYLDQRAAEEERTVLPGATRISGLGVRWTELPHIVQCVAGPDRPNSGRCDGMERSTERCAPCVLFETLVARFVGRRSGLHFSETFLHKR